MTKQTERSLRIFKNKIWRKLCGPIINEMLSYNRAVWHDGTSINNKLCQKLKVRSHNKDRIGKNVRIAMKWISRGRRLRGRPKKRWIDVVAKALRNQGVENWREVIQDRDRWRNVIIAVKTLR